LGKLKEHAVIAILLAVLIPTAASLGQTITERLSVPEFTLKRKGAGVYAIHLDGFGAISDPGAPRLPSKIIYISLPPGAKVMDVSFSWDPEQIVQHDIDIEPAPALLISGLSDDQPKMFDAFREEQRKLISAGRFYPETPLVNHGITYSGVRPLVKIQFTPFSWNPATRELRLTENASITVSYTSGNNNLPVSPAASAGSAAGGLYKDGTAEDLSAAPADGSGSGKLLVLSSRDMETALQPLLLWKQWNQVQSEFIAVEDICSSTTGADKAEQVYNYLKERYFNGVFFDNLLLVGASDIVPIRKLYPNPNNHGYSGELPTDMYYTDLTCNWDADGDGYFGEFGEDQINWMPEINVGRIPWSDTTVVAQIIEKIIHFERDNSGWKNNGLLVGAMSSFEHENNYSYYYRDTDGAALMELMKNSIFSGMQTTTLYEKGGVSPSVYECDIPLTAANLQSAWQSRDPACLTWWAHGNTQSAFRKYWRSDNGNNIPDNTELILEKFLSDNDYQGDARHQPIIFANACDNGWPEKISLARSLIRNGSSGIVASSRLSYATIGWDEISDGGNASLTYYFWQEFITDALRSGSALTQARLIYLSNHNTTFYDLQNVYTYNY